MSTANSTTSTATFSRPSDLRTKYLPGSVVCDASGSPLHFRNVVAVAGGRGVIVGSTFSTSGLGKNPKIDAAYFHRSTECAIGRWRPATIRAVVIPDFRGHDRLARSRMHCAAAAGRIRGAGCDLWGIAQCLLGFLTLPEQRFDLAITCESQ